MGGLGRLIGDAGLNNHQRKMMKIFSRLMVTKLPDRAAVHGMKPLVTETVNVEEVGEEIDKGKQEKEQKIEEVERKIDSQINSRTIEEEEEEEEEVEKKIDSPSQSTITS
ncbi:hypothetical protein MKX01_033986 [Papaver californicum]|nr:hypothetical protein MKX01_033986 [Papaver californicum]